MALATLTKCLFHSRQFHFHWLHRASWQTCTCTYVIAGVSRIISFRSATIIIIRHKLRKKTRCMNTVNKFRVAQVKWQRRCWRRWIVIDFSPEWWYLRRMLFFVESKVYYMTNPKKIGGIPMVRPFHMLHWGKCCWSDASLYPFSIQHSHCVRIPHSSATM